MCDKRLQCRGRKRPHPSTVKRASARAGLSVTAQVAVNPRHRYSTAPSDELFTCVCNKLRQLKVHRLAEACASGHSVARSKGNHGHPHPKGIQAGSVAVVGKRFQAKVDALVSREILLAGLRHEPFDPIRRHTKLREQFQRALAVRALLCSAAAGAIPRPQPGPLTKAR